MQNLNNTSFEAQKKDEKMVKAAIDAAQKVSEDSGVDIPLELFLVQRNGHMAANTIDEENKTIDIRSNAVFPANALSNLAENKFVFDGVECSSMEGLLQSLKTPDEAQQRILCKMRGGSAKSNGKKLKSWAETGSLYWQGRKMDRNSKEYNDFLKRAYQACYDQCEVYRVALKYTDGYSLKHSIGSDDKRETILTRAEFVEMLDYLRNNN